MRLPVIINILLLFIINTLSADCICNFLKTTTLDTLNPGEVRAERCYHYYSGDTCFIDTSYEKDLLAGLLGEYNSKQYAIIGSITQVKIIPETLWREDFRRESLLITIDTCFKGNYPSNEFWVYYEGYCKALSSGLLNSKFIAFFNQTNLLTDLAVDPGFDCGEESGYFVVNGGIVKKGDGLAGMPGISVDLARFLDTVKALGKVMGFDSLWVGKTWTYLYWQADYLTYAEKGKIYTGDTVKVEVTGINGNLYTLAENSIRANSSAKSTVTFQLEYHDSLMRFVTSNDYYSLKVFGFVGEFDSLLMLKPIDSNLVEINPESLASISNIGNDIGKDRFTGHSNEYDIFDKVYKTVNLCYDKTPTYVDGFGLLGVYSRQNGIISSINFGGFSPVMAHGYDLLDTGTLNSDNREYVVDPFIDSTDSNAWFRVTNIQDSSYKGVFAVRETNGGYYLPIMSRWPEFAGKIVKGYFMCVNDSIWRLNEQKVFIITEIVGDRILPGIQRGKTASFHSSLTVYPSPFNPAAHIILNNGAPGRVTLGIYNIRGEAVKRMDLGYRPWGTVEIVWDGKDDGGHHLVSGAYFIKATAGNTALTKKAVLIR